MLTSKAKSRAADKSVRPTLGPSSPEPAYSASVQRTPLQAFADYQRTAGPSTLPDDSRANHPAPLGMTVLGAVGDDISEEDTPRFFTAEEAEAQSSSRVVLERLGTRPFDPSRAPNL